MKFTYVVFGLLALAVIVSAVAQDKQQKRHNRVAARKAKKEARLAARQQAGENCQSVVSYTPCSAENKMNITKTSNPDCATANTEPVVKTVECLRTTYKMRNNGCNISKTIDYTQCGAGGDLSQATITITMSPVSGTCDGVQERNFNRPCLKTHSTRRAKKGGKDKKQKGNRQAKINKRKMKKQDKAPKQ